MDFGSVSTKNDSSFDEPRETFNSKKRKLANKILSSVANTTPKLVDGIQPLNGILQFNCPSTCKFRKHIISLESTNDNLTIKCDCANSYSKSQSQHCTHINSLMIYIIKKYVDNACQFNEMKDSYIETNKSIDTLLCNLDNMVV